MRHARVHGESLWGAARQQRSARRWGGRTPGGEHAAWPACQRPTCSCCTTAACCSGDSPSMTGLAASISPPSLTRMYTSPAAPPATASSAGAEEGGGGGTWRPEGQEAGVVFTRRRVQRAARRLGSPQSGSCGAVPVGFGTAWLATSAAALWRHSAARHAPRGARPRPGGWLTGHVALGLDPRVGDALALGHAHALDDAALRHSPRKHPAWGAYVGGTQAASKSVRCPHSQPGSACCNVPADRPDIRSACLLPLLALWP